MIVAVWLLACGHYIGGPSPECIDVDGDGVARVPSDACPGLDRDCDDMDPERFPGHDEEPYDRIDQDCDRADLVDVDEDGFPGISRSDWETITRESGNLAEWPVDVADGNDVTNYDCDDESSLIHPGADDPPDDGVDQDCDNVQ